MIDNIWKPIDDAPKDGRPIWARGYNGGSILGGYHYAVVAWYEWEDGEGWYLPAPAVHKMELLREYMPDAFAPVAPRILLS